MQFDFESIIDRREKDALAADLSVALGSCTAGETVSVREGFSLIPMWVADMNFATAPSVIKAMEARLEHPVFGYYRPSEAYYQAILDWQSCRNGVLGLTKECIGYENGVLGGVVSAMQAICPRGGKVLVHAPTYVGFTSSLKNAGYEIVLSSLVQDGQGIWRMDLADMEEKLRGQKIHAAILCSPHNPSGRVWARWELEQAMELYRKYDVYVISDEIWSDLVLAGHKHIPTQSVSEDARQRTVALYAPSKTFNLAGLIGSYHIIYNEALRHRVEKEASVCHYNSMNVLSMHALLGAYSPDGQAWVDALRQVLTENVDYACQYIQTHFEGVKLSKPEGTYMLFLDCEDWCRQHGKSLTQLLCAGVEVGVLWQDGRPFHGQWAIRMNLASPLSLVKEALERLDKYVFHAE